MKTNFLLLALLILSSSIAFCQNRDSDHEVEGDGVFYSFKYSKASSSKLDTPQKIQTEVYHSMPCNACPQSQWEALNSKNSNH